MLRRNTNHTIEKQTLFHPGFMRYEVTTKDPGTYEDWIDIDMRESMAPWRSRSHTSSDEETREKDKHI